MEDPKRWKEVFQSREGKDLLKNNLDAHQCAIYLYSVNVITLTDQEVVVHCVTTNEKCVKLLDLLLTKDNYWIALLDYLRKANQKNVVRDLENLYQNTNLVRDDRIIYYQTSESLPILKQWNVPQRNPYFTGRGQLLEQLASSLKPTQDNVTVISACQGLGGVGKTQLAIEFAYRRQADYPYTFWFTAEEPSQIETDYSRLAYLLNIDTQQPLDVIVAEMKAWLDRHPGGLLVYDNASNPEALDRYLPTTGTSSILVTSRTTKWHWLGKSFAVDVFTAEEARVYFRELLGDLFETSSLETLAETLGYLPLALAQVGAYMKETKISPSRYIVLYEQDKQRLLADKTLPSFHHEPVLITWDVTMQEIQKKSKLAPALLALCACLNSTNIPHFLLNDWAHIKLNNSKRILLSRFLQRPRREVFEEALGILVGYSMLTINQDDKSISIHRLVQEVIRLKWSVKDRRQILKSAIDLIRRCSPNQHSTSEDFTKTQHLLPHSEALLGYLDKGTGSIQSSDFISTLLKMLSVLHDEYTISRNDHKRCVILERELSIREKNYGPNHTSVATTLNNLSNAYGALGKHAKAQKLLNRVFNIRQKHHGPDNPEVANTLNKLGNACGNRGEYEKQRELLQRALAIREQHYGPDHPEVATILNDLGMVYGNSYEYLKQQELLERALGIEEKRHGVVQSEVASTLNNLGTADGKVGVHSVQIEVLERALKIREKHYGPHHPMVATTLNNLGIAYGSLGHYAMQCELLKRAHSIQESHYGPNHPKVATTLNNLGMAYGNLGHYVKQQELLERALLIQETYYGPDHPCVATTLDNLGMAYGNLGAYDKLREFLERALKIREKHYGTDHPLVSFNLNNLGMVYGKEGENNVQRKFLERAVSIQEAYYGPDHPWVAITSTNLGNAYRDLGQYDRSEQLLQRALPIIKKHYEPDHQNVVQMLNSLGMKHAS